MKPNDTYICGQADCDEVFFFKRTNLFNSPICPICGNKSTLNLGRVLNRKEEKDETTVDNSIGRSDRVSDRKSLVDCETCVAICQDTEQTPDCLDQGGDRRSGGEDIESCINDIKADGLVRGSHPILDVFRELVQAKRGIEQTLSRLNANPQK